VSTDIEAERLLHRARGSTTPEDGARLLFEAFLAVSRTMDGGAMLPLVDELRVLWTEHPGPEVDYLYHLLAGVVGVRARRPDGPEHLETALCLYAGHGLDADPLFVEGAILATLTLIRPHETRARFAAQVERLELDPARRARLLAMIGLGDAWAGNLVRGQVEMLEARQLAIAAGREDVRAEVTSWLIKCEALRGDLDASAEHLVEARDLAGRLGSPWVAAQVTEGAAALYFARGDVEGWVGLLELMVGSGGGGDSGLLYEYRWELATHRLVTGHPAAARELLLGVPEPPPGWPGSPAMAAWRAWILDPDDPAAARGFEAALVGLTQPAERLPRARMAWLLGAHHARAARRVEAVRLLEAACAGYATIGAAGMLALVARELHVAGAGPAVPPALLESTAGEQPLTGAEVRVAVAVADGLSNRETADRLYVSVKTIEFHLGNIFRKLGVRNRTELAVRVGRLT
jgi:DNA-binding CsgD family transcriptional regulator